MFIFSAGVGLWFLRNGSFMKIDEIKVSGTRMVPPEDIISLIKSKNARHGGFLGFILPENHRLAYKNDEELTSLIKTQFPRVKEITIKKDYENRAISVAVSERHEKITWCADEGEARYCFWLDEEGFVIGEAPDSKGELVFVISDKTGRKISIGTETIDQEKLQNLLESAKMTKNFGWATKEITIDDPLFKEASIIVSSGQKIFVSLEQNSAVSGRPILETLIASDKWPEVEYVDLRIDGKGFYKLK